MEWDMRNLVIGRSLSFLSAATVISFVFIGSEFSFFSFSFESVQDDRSEFSLIFLLDTVGRYWTLLDTGIPLRLGESC